MQINRLPDNIANVIRLTMQQGISLLLSTDHIS